MEQKSRIKRNIAYAFATQGLSLLLSLLTAIVLPKFMDKVNFGYWSLLCMYTGYIGIFNLGINDGVYLKAGGTEYEDMDKGLLGSQLRISTVYQTIFAIILSVAVVIFCHDANKRFIFFMTIVYMMIFNHTLYFGGVFQAANETRLFSISTMLDKLVFMVSVIILFIGNCGDYIIYTWFYMSAKLVALMYCIYKGRDIVFAKGAPLNIALKEAWDSIKIGINLTIATIVSGLILGSGRMMIEDVWGVESFADFSFSLTLTNFFLLFISQLSMVFFPAMRQIGEEKQKDIFVIVKNILNVILPMAFIMYIPAKEILQLWLPKYAESFKYMAILLPVCIFDGKMNLVCSTYFKVLRKERFLLGINVFSMALSILLSVLGAYIIKDMNVVIIGMVVAIGARYFVSQIYLEYLLDKDSKKRTYLIQMVEEVLLSVICVYVCWNTTSIVAFGITAVVLMVYYLRNRNSVKYVWEMVRSKLNLKH